MRILRGIAVIVALLGAPAALLACVLIAIAVAWHSRWFALGILLFYLLLPAILLGGLAGSKQAVPRFAGLLPIAGSASFLLSWMLAPDGSAPQESRLQAVVIDSSGIPIERSYNRCSPSNLVAEVDQLALGNKLIPLMDSLIDSKKAERIETLFGAVYGEMRAGSPGSVAVGSELGSVYRDIAGWSFQSGHGYVYLPGTAEEGGADAGPLPVLLFLHGSLGNFKGYQWVLQSLAERRGMAIVAPSFGIGKWDHADGQRTILEWISYIEKSPHLDDRRIVIAGLSNGGRGLTGAAAAMPGRFSGFIGISPVLQPDKWIASAQERSAGSPPQAPIHREPLLVIHGNLDIRIPEQSVHEAVKLLENAGVPCTYEVFPEEDHFLFFSQPEPVLLHIEDWMDSQLPGFLNAPAPENRQSGSD